MILICFVTTFFFFSGKFLHNFSLSLLVCLFFSLGGCAYMYFNVPSFSRPTTSTRFMWSEGRIQSSLPDCCAPVLPLVRLQSRKHGPTLYLRLLWLTRAVTASGELPQLLLTRNSASPLLVWLSG